MKKIILISAVVLSSCGVFQKKSLVDLTKKGYTKIQTYPIGKDDLRPYIYALINGKKGKFLLDTGAGVTPIRQKSLEKFGLVEKESGGKIRSIKLKGLQSEIEFKDKELEILEGDFGEGLDGIIGADIFVKAKAVIDYGTNTLYLTKNKTHNKIDEKFLEDLLIKKGYIKIQFLTGAKAQHFSYAHINEKKGYFGVDTGSQISVVGKKKMEKFGLKHDYNVPEEEMKTADVKIKFGTLTFKDFSYMTIDLDDFNEELKRNGEKEMDGIIGSPLLLRGNAIIDYGTNTLYLKK